MALPENDARVFVVGILVELRSPPKKKYRDAAKLSDFFTERHLPDLATAINDARWHFVRVRIEEVASCEKILDLIKLVAKVGK
jgi:hypothetical protein